MGRKGFTLIEIVVVLAVLAILAGLLIPPAYRIFTRGQEKDTISALQNLKKAILGDPTIIMNEARVSFGYLGDMGTFPSSLQDLWVKGSQPAYSYDPILKIAAGWNGPYLDVGTSDNLSGLTLDQWGNLLVYDKTGGTDPTTNAQWVAKLTSYGPDEVSGTTDDLSLSIYNSEAYSKVLGFIKDSSGNPLQGASVTMNYPQNGVLVKSSSFSDANGFYMFSNVPYGNRSITVDPKLVYSTGSAITTGAAHDAVTFKVTNFSAAAITITSLKAIFDVTPTAYFEEVQVGGKSVWKFATYRASSGDTINFSFPQTVLGGGAVANSVVVCAQSPVTQVPELVAGMIGKGATLQISLLKFRDAKTGGADAVNMAGVNFEVDFSDGSIVVFIPQ